MKHELLSPAGSLDICKAVINAGADAVYLGGDKFGARAFAKNFTQSDIREALDFAHLRGKKIFLTVNTLLKNKEIETELFTYLKPLYEYGLDAVIVQDYGVFQFIYRNFPGLALHASTQMSVANVAGAKFLMDHGAERIVTARELSSAEIRRIYDETGVEIESFIHGALCYCYSGQCLMSSMLGGRSGNRGRCAQPCRLAYQVTDDRGNVLHKKEKYPLSPKDLCTIELLPELCESGIYSFKIEGRMKKLEYAAGVTSIYRKYLDLYEESPEDYKVEAADMERLLCLGNRNGFTKGYYEMRNGRSMMTLTDSSHSSNDAKTAYEDYKAQKPAAPVMSDFTGEADIVSDGTSADVSASASSSTDDTAVTADTTALENELEKASNNLAELQSELSSKEAAAEADTGAVTEEEKEKMEITNNLSELDQMSAQELVEAAKKGIKADFNGVVTKVSVVEGATATQGMELFTLQNTDKVDVNVNVSKYDYDKVKEGQSADITVAGKTYEGEVTSISHVATQNEKGASLISADIRIKNPDENIFLGVDAKVTIHAEEADNVVVLPSEVVNIGKEGSFCYVLENGVITKKDITTGISSDEYVEVLDGIKEGDEVIRDLGSLEEGMQAEAADRSGDVNGENTETDNAEEGV